MKYYSLLIVAVLNLQSVISLANQTFIENRNNVIISSLLQNITHLSVHLNYTNDFTTQLINNILQQTKITFHVNFITTTNSKSYEFEENFAKDRLIILKNYTNFEVVLQKYISHGGILFCVIQEDLNTDIVLRNAKNIWSTVRIYKVYYIGNNEVLLYNPFGKPSDNEEYGILVKINEDNTGYLNGILNNLAGYPLRTYIFDSVYSTVIANSDGMKIIKATGADGIAAELISKIMNFTMELQMPDDDFFGARLENGSYNGAIGRLLRYESDLTFTGFFLKDYLTRDIEFSTSVYMDKLCCYVMKAKRIPQSIVPLFAVNLNIWLGFILTGMLCPFIWSILRRLNLQLHIEQMDKTRERKNLFNAFQYYRIFIDTWVVWVRVNIVKFPPFYSERLFIVSLCLVSVIFGALFESSLATVYIRPLYYNDISTLQELSDANYRIYIKHAAMKDDLFYGHSSQVYMNLEKKLLLVAELEERLIEMMSKRGGFAAVTRESSLFLNDIYYFMAKKIHMIPECPKNYHIAFIYPRYSPFADSINVLLLKFLASGLFIHWIDNMYHKAKITIYDSPNYITDQLHTWKILTLQDLQLSFYALFIGITLAIISLICEYFIRWKKKSNKTDINLSAKKCTF